MSKGKKRSGARPGRPQPLRGTKGKRKGARLWYVGGQQLDRKSGSAGMPRPISYAVFCLKKKNIKGIDSAVADTCNTFCPRAQPDTIGSHSSTNQPRAFLS